MNDDDDEYSDGGDDSCGSSGNDDDDDELMKWNGIPRELSLCKFLFLSSNSNLTEIAYIPYRLSETIYLHLVSLAPIRLQNMEPC